MVRRHGISRGRSRRPGSARGLLVSLAIAALVLAGAFVPIGQARANAPPNAPNLQGGFIVGNGQALVIVGYLGWVDTWTAAGNGSDVYANQFYLGIFNLRDVNLTLPIAVEQKGVFVLNVTLALSPVSQGAETLNLPADTNWVRTVLWFGGAPYWFGRVATPVTFLPNSILNVGGLDLFSLAIVSFALVNIVAGVGLGRLAMRRAIWAPRFSAIIWAHVPIFMLAGAIIFDYQYIDATFAGWSPIVYPFFLGPFAFLWSLSLFNRASKVLVLQETVTQNDELGYYGTGIRIGRVNGRLAYVGDDWGAFWARVWHHHVWAESSVPNAPKPWLAPLLMLPSPTGTFRERRKARRLAARGPLSASEALTRFPVLNSDEKSDYHFIAHGKAANPPEIHFPRLAFTKIVHQDAKIKLDTTSGAPIVVRKARDVRRLALPHYPPVPDAPAVELDDEHYALGAAVHGRFARISDLVRMVSKYAHAAAVLDSVIETKIDEGTYAILRTISGLANRSTSPYTDAEAADLAGRLDALVQGQDPEPKP